MFIVTYGVGYGPVPWALLGEMFSVSVKSYAATLATSMCWAVGFVLVLGFEIANEVIGVYWTFWIFTIFTATGFMFILCIVFETKGLNLQEIQARLVGGKVRNRKFEN